MEKVIAVMSFTGKVGKSTVSNNILFPRMPGAKMIRLETLNVSGRSGADDEMKMKGRELDKLQDELAKTKSAIVDIGSSNVEAFVLALNQQGNAHLDFDFFIIPVEANSAKHNEFEEAVKTIEALTRIGISPEKIKVVFNKLNIDNVVEEEMVRLFNYHRKNKNFTLNKRAVIHETPAFKAIGAVQKSYDQLLADDTDYRSAIKNIPMEKDEERTAMVKLMRAQGYVQTLDREFNDVFEALFGDQ